VSPGTRFHHIVFFDQVSVYAALSRVRRLIRFADCTTQHDGDRVDLSAGTLTNDTILPVNETESWVVRADFDMHSCTAMRWSIST
jgi:hypothetical protein